MEQSISFNPITIVGTTEPKDNSFSKTYLFSPPNLSLRSHRGELFQVISLASPDPSLDLETLATQIFSVTSENYFGEEAGSVLDALKEAVQAGQERMRVLTKREGGQIPLDLSWVVASLWGKALYVFSFGGGYAATLRQSDFLPLTETSFATLELKDRDILILATSLFASNIGEETLKKVFKELSVEEWVFRFKGIIAEKEEVSRYGAIFLPVEVREVPGEEEVIEILEIPRPEPVFAPFFRFFQSIFSRFQASSWKFKLSSRGRSTSPPVPVEERKVPISRNLQIRERLKKLWQRGPKMSPLASSEKEPEIFLRDRPSGERGKKLMLVGVLALLLLVSVIGTRWWNVRNTKDQQVASFLSLAEGKIEEGEKSLTINPERTRVLLDEAADALGRVQGLKTQTTKVDELDGKIAALLLEAYQTQEVKPRVLVDLSEEVEQGSLSGLVKLEDSLYTYSTQNARLINVDLSEDGGSNALGVSLRSLAPDLRPPILAGFLDTIYLYTPGQDVVAVSVRDQAHSTALESDLRWKEVMGIGTYLGNLYLLDAADNQIYRYIAMEGGFSKLFNYFTQTVDLSGVTDFAIDGAIYLLYEDGRIEKYLGGVREEFSWSGLYPPLLGSTKIITDADSERIYLVKDNFILIFDKEGVYKQRLLLEGIERIEELVVDEGQGKVWMLSEGKVYEVGL